MWIAILDFNNFSFNLELLEHWNTYIRGMTLRLVVQKISSNTLVALADWKF